MGSMQTFLTALPKTLIPLKFTALKTQLTQLAERPAGVPLLAITERLI